MLLLLLFHWQKNNDGIICLMTWIVQQKYKHVKQEKNCILAQGICQKYKERSVYIVGKKKCANEEASSHYQLTITIHHRIGRKWTIPLLPYIFITTFSWMSERSLFLYIFYFLSLSSVPLLQLAENDQRDKFSLALLRKVREAHALAITIPTHHKLKIAK